MPLLFTVLLISKACRAHSTTVTASVGAAFQLALADTISSATPAQVAIPAAATDPSPTLADATETKMPMLVSLSCAVDTRRLYRPPLDAACLAYHASGLAPYACQVTPLDETSLWTAAVQVL